MSLAHEGIGGGRVTNMKNSSYFTTYITEGGGVPGRSECGRRAVREVPVGHLGRCLVVR